MLNRNIQNFDHDILTGKSSNHVVTFAIKDGQQGPLVQEIVKKNLVKLAAKAKEAGFDLQLASGFRSYERQLLIWNEKCQGLRPIEDDQGKIIQIDKMSPENIVEAILRWSAVPGASRHHWGTDVDVFDGKAVKANYQVQLSNKEVSPGGIFYQFHQWLDQIIKEGNSCGFFRPYNEDLGGVGPEKWHLSFAPLSTPMFEAYDLDLFLSVIEKSKMNFREIIIRDAELIFDNYIKRICPSPF